MGHVGGKRLWGLLITLLLAIGVAAGVTLTQHVQDIRQHASGPYQPTDGWAIYDSCGNDQPECLHRLDVEAQGGFKLVMDHNVWGNQPTMQKIIDYANHAQNDGMKMIWSFQDFWQDHNQYIQEFPGVAATCGCSDNAGFITYVVNQLKNLPSTWGYYIADEATIADHPAVKSIADIIHAADPNHPRLFIAFAWTTNAVNAILSAYADIAEVLATDYYPTGNSSNGINYTKNLAAAVQTVANNTGRSSAMVLQAHSMNHYRNCGLPYPSVADMLSQYTQTVNYSNPRLIMWYSYLDVAYLHTCPEDDISHWNNLVSVIQSAPYGACANDGGDNGNPYPQCSRTIGGCAYNYPGGYVLTVHKCSDGVYICPANEARPANPGECGVPNPTPTPAPIPPTPTPSVVFSPPTPTPIPFSPPTPTATIIVPTPTPLPQQYICNRCSTSLGCTKTFFNAYEQACLNPLAGTVQNITDCRCAKVSGGDNTACVSCQTIFPSPQPTPQLTRTNPSCIQPVCSFLPPNCYFQNQTLCTCGTVVCNPSSSSSFSSASPIPSFHTSLTFSLHVSGITKTPNHPQQTATITFGDGTSMVTSGTALALYNATTGTFDGTYDMGTINPSNISLITFKLPNTTTYPAHLSKSMQPGQNNILPPITLQSGDINNDGEINVLDYNIFLQCFHGVSSTCTPDLYLSSDVNDDGIVDGIDFNILIRGMLHD